MRRLAALVLVAAAVPALAAPPPPTAKQQELIAEAWAVDHNDLYPPSTTWAELRKELEPAYIKELPLKDGWGNELAWVVSADRKHYRVVSAGADKDRHEDDIVFADGTFLQAPKNSH